MPSLTRLRRGTRFAGFAPSEEAYRILRSNLEIALPELRPASVVVTSAQAGEGKTSTCVNLARAMALAGYRVVLADFDLRHPDAHRWLGVSNDNGLADVLLRRRTLQECLQFIKVEANGNTGEGLYFLPTGAPVLNPAELLGDPRTHALLDMLAGKADVVLIDSPPVLPVADSLVVGRMVGGALLVVETRKTPVNAVKQAKDALTRSQTRLLGVVVNKLHSRDAHSDHGYAYDYGYPHRPTTRPVVSPTYRRIAEDDTSSDWLPDSSAGESTAEHSAADDLSSFIGSDQRQLGPAPAPFHDQTVATLGPPPLPLIDDDAGTANGSGGSGNGTASAPPAQMPGRQPIAERPTS